MHVDWLALSHPDQDHFGGFDFIARNFSPDEFWDVAVENHDASYEHFLATLYELKVPIHQIDATITRDGHRWRAPRRAESSRDGLDEPQ